SISSSLCVFHCLSIAAQLKLFYRSLSSCTRTLPSPLYEIEAKLPIIQPPRNRRSSLHWPPMLSLRDFRLCPSRKFACCNGNMVTH
ncbi:hypothetical protein H0H93_014008, partial [Arthromyces matolae]